MPEEAGTLFVFDVDGTLLTSRHTIAPQTRSAVRELLRAGQRVALASARPPRSVAALSQDLLGAVAETISLNGALIAHGSETLRARALAAPAAAALIGRARALGLEINLYSGWRWLVEAVGPAIDAEADIVGFAPTRVDDLAAEASGAVHKILLIGAPEAVREYRDWAAGEPTVTASLSKPGYCEVVARGVAKSDAVAFLAQRLGVPPTRVVAFGDGENDLPMLTAAGVGVAMGNAVEAVRRAADLITLGNDEGGIPAALQRLGYLTAPDGGATDRPS